MPRERRHAAAPDAAATAIDTEPVFTPDGRSIYFVSDRGGGPQIYRMPAAGGNAERVTFGGSYNISPAHQPRRARAGLHHPSGRGLQAEVQELASGTPRPSPTPATTKARASRRTAGCIVYARRAHRPRRADDHHARWPDQDPPAHHRRRHARAGVGPVRPLIRDHPLPPEKHDEMHSRTLGHRRLPLAAGCCSPGAARSKLDEAPVESRTRPRRRRGAAAASGAAAAARRAVGVATGRLSKQGARPRAAAQRVVYFDFDSFVDQGRVPPDGRSPCQAAQRPTAPSA